MGIDKSTQGLKKCLVRCDCGYEGTRESQALRDGNSNTEPAMRRVVYVNHNAKTYRTLMEI